MKEEVALSRYTTLGTGGAARWFDSPESVEELGARLAWAQSEGLPVAVVGLGSNLLVADDGFPGLVVKLAGELARAEAAEGCSSPAEGPRSPSASIAPVRLSWAAWSSPAPFPGRWGEASG